MTVRDMKHLLRLCGFTALAVAFGCLLLLLTSVAFWAGLDVVGRICMTVTQIFFEPSRRVTSGTTFENYLAWLIAAGTWGAIFFVAHYLWGQVRRHQ